MIYSRNKRTFRKRTYRKRRTAYRKRYPIRRSLGNPRQKVFFFKRFCNLPALIAGADGNDAFTPRSFGLSDLPDYTDFTNLFDWYKINKIVVRLLPYFSQTTDVPNSATFGTFSSASNLRIFTAIDTGLAPTLTAANAVNTIRQYSNCKVTPYIKGQTRSFRPRYDGLDAETVESQTVGPTPWIDTTSTSAIHYGLLIAIDTSGLNPASINQGDVLLRIEATYYMSFKSVN